jgi:hypothetical protein
MMADQPAQVGTFQHGEAFCHMQYVSNDGQVVRSVWNSRDGVTPFGFRDPETGADLTHVNWSMDRCEPAYEPKISDYVWIDLHPERALQLATEKVEAWWDAPDYPMSSAFPNKAEAVKVIYKDMTEIELPDGSVVPRREPDLVVWSDSHAW